LWCRRRITKRCQAGQQWRFCNPRVMKSLLEKRTQQMRFEPKIAAALCLLVVVGGTAAGRQRPRRSKTNGGQPGNFDYYVLALSWSPEFCHNHPQRAGCRAADPMASSSTDSGRSSRTVTLSTAQIRECVPESRTQPVLSAR